MSEWSEYYKKRVGDSYPAHCKIKYKAFIDELHSLNHISEEGCGIATISKIVYHKSRKKHTAFDLCPEQLNLARVNIGDRKIDLVQGSILNFQYVDNEPDIIFSHGVLEHFNDEDIKRIIHRQRFTAKKVVHYVPLEGWKTPSFGDERLLPLQYWIDLVKPTRTIEFNNGLDAVLVWEL
jgi:cyclopropane fatty-acyl-phospholipid synthase-like methyltransferase